MSLLSILYNYRLGIVAGLTVTLKLCFIIWIAGIIFGTTLGYFGSRFPAGIGLIVRTLAFIVSGIPVLVLLFWLHYPIQAHFQVSINPFLTAAFVLSAVNTFTTADTIRNELANFPNQYRVAAAVCGMSFSESFLKVELPIIFRNVAPTVLSGQVSMLHLTLFSSLISVEEIFRVAQRMNALLYQPIQIYTALAFFFLLVCLPLNWFVHRLKNRYTRNISEH